MHMAHVYVIGATGSGKSNYLKSILPEGAFCVLDKHGTLAREIADSMPCIYWRPADLEWPIGLNPLQNVHADHRWKVTADIVSAISDIWNLGPETPRLLYYLRSSLRLLLDTNGTTLLDVRRVLSDDNFRARLLRKCTDTQTRQTWDEFSNKKEQQQAQEISSLQNKVAALADPLPLRLILGQPTSTISIPKLLATGTSLVLDLSDLGDEPAALMGALVINAFKQAAEASPDPRPYDLIIDEFQNFGTNIIATILSEARKWQLNLTIAHQFIHQLEPVVAQAVLGNCSTIVSFRVGPDDAPIIGKALDWGERDLQDLPVGTARMRTLIDGQPTSAMLLRTERVELPGGWLEKNIRNTRAKYGRRRGDVERRQNRPQRAERRRSWGN
jgi:hypothetical protein